MSNFKLHDEIDLAEVNAQTINQFIRNRAFSSELGWQSFSEFLIENPIDVLTLLILLSRYSDDVSSFKGFKANAIKAEKYQPLKELAERLVRAKNFKSRRNAAKTITPEIIAESERLGIALSKDQAEITITGWLKNMGLPANI